MNLKGSFLVLLMNRLYCCIIYDDTSVRCNSITVAFPTSQYGIDTESQFILK